MHQQVLRVIYEQTPMRYICGQHLGCPPGWIHGYLDHFVRETPSPIVQLVDHLTFEGQYQEEILLPINPKARIYRLIAGRQCHSRHLMGAGAANCEFADFSQWIFKLKLVIQNRLTLSSQPLTALHWLINSVIRNCTFVQDMLLTRPIYSASDRQQSLFCRLMETVELTYYVLSHHLPLTPLPGREAFRLLERGGSA